MIANLSVIISSTAVVCTVCGWFIGHNLSRKRDLENKKKEIRISYLINAFRQFENAVQKDYNSDEFTKLESAIADIQLFGSKRQIELSREFSKEIAKHGTADCTILLKDIRDDLRHELGLEPITSPWLFFRTATNKYTINSHGCETPTCAAWPAPGSSAAGSPRRKG